MQQSLYCFRKTPCLLLKMLFFDFKIILGKEIFDQFYLISSSWKLIVPIEISHKFNDEAFKFIEKFNNISDIKTVKRFKVTMDGYLVSLFYYVINTSVSYRTLFSKHLIKKKNIYESRTGVNRTLIYIHVIPPKQEMIDYKGNEMFEISCLERRELDNAMAWLSTLGGAFSALGDSIEVCATIAGKISVRQLQIAIRLGDPYLVARCKLFMALSLIQKHKFKKAKEIIQAQYLFANQGPIVDKRLKSMCLGIWTKLKYDKKRLKELP